MLPATQPQSNPTPSATDSSDQTQVNNPEASASSTPSASESAAPSDSASPSASASPSTVSTALSPERAKELADRNKDGQLSDTPTEQPENNSDLKWATEQALFDL